MASGEALIFPLRTQAPDSVRTSLLDGSARGEVGGFGNERHLSPNRPEWGEETSTPGLPTSDWPVLAEIGANDPADVIAIVGDEQ